MKYFLIATFLLLAASYSNAQRKVQLDFSTDLDLVSEKLFGLRTSGGDEYCPAVIFASLKELILI